MKIFTRITGDCYGHSANGGNGDKGHGNQFLPIITAELLSQLLMSTFITKILQGLLGLVGKFTNILSSSVSEVGNEEVGGKEELRSVDVDVDP